MLLNRLEDRLQPGILRRFDPEVARRQLLVSLILVIAIGIAAVVLDLLLTLNALQMYKTSLIAGSHGVTERIVYLPGPRGLVSGLTAEP